MFKPLPSPSAAGGDYVGLFLVLLPIVCRVSKLCRYGFVVYNVMSYKFDSPLA